MLGKIAPGVAETLDGMAIYVDGAPVVSIPIAIAWFFLGVVFKGFVPGTEILKDGTEVELYRSYISGAILLGIAPCTAMVLMLGVSGPRQSRPYAGHGRD